MISIYTRSVDRAQQFEALDWSGQTGFDGEILPTGRKKNVARVQNALYLYSVYEKHRYQTALVPLEPFDVYGVHILCMYVSGESGNRLVRRRRAGGISNYSLSRLWPDDGYFSFYLESGHSAGSLRSTCVFVDVSCWFYCEAGMEKWSMKAILTSSWINRLLGISEVDRVECMRCHGIYVFFFNDNKFLSCYS